MDFHVFTTFTIIILGLFFSVLTNENSLKVRKTYLFIVSVILLLESALRGMSVGDDTLTYFDSFQSVKYTSWADIYRYFTFFGNNNYENRNQGYDLFQKIFQLFSDDFRVYLFFIAILFFSSLYHFLLRNTFNLYELILAFLIYSALFYYFFSITGIKQTITSSVALFCIRYIKERKLMHFVIPIMLASFIHISVLVFLPFYFFSGLKKIKLNFLIALFLFIIIFVFKRYVVTILITDTVYETYLSDLAGRGTLGFTSLLLLVVLLSYFIIDKMAKVYPNYILYYNGILMALVLVPLTWVNSNAMRVVQYYSIFLIVFAPKIIEVLYRKNILFKRIAYFICIVILLSFILKAPSLYKFFWEESSIYRDL
jgi:hypothetical protein